METVKVYRASQAIASRAKSCPACGQRIRVGMSVAFLPSTNQQRHGTGPLAHHKGCVLHRLEA